MGRQGWSRGYKDNLHPCGVDGGGDVNDRGDHSLHDGGFDYDGHSRHDGGFDDDDDHSLHDGDFDDDDDDHPPHDVLVYGDDGCRRHDSVVGDGGFGFRFRGGGRLWHLCCHRHGLVGDDGGVGRLWHFYHRHGLVGDDGGVGDDARTWPAHI